MILFSSCGIFNSTVNDEAINTQDQANRKRITYSIDSTTGAVSDFSETITPKTVLLSANDIYTYNYIYSAEEDEFVADEGAYCYWNICLQFDMDKAYPIIEIINPENNNTDYISFENGGENGFYISLLKNANYYIYKGPISVIIIEKDQAVGNQQSSSLAIPVIKAETWECIIIDLLKQPVLDIITCFDFASSFIRKQPNNRDLDELQFELGAWKFSWDISEQSLSNALRAAFMFTLVSYCYGDTKDQYKNFSDFFDAEYYK